MLNTQKLYVIDENGFFYEKLEDLYHMSWNLCPHSSTANILKVNLRQAKYLKRKVLFWAKSCRRTLPIFRKMTLRSQISYLAGICSLLLVLSRATFIISIISFFIYIFACARSHPIFGGALRHPDWRATCDSCYRWTSLCTAAYSIAAIYNIYRNIDYINLSIIFANIRICGCQP